MKPLTYAEAEERMLAYESSIERRVSLGVAAWLRRQLPAIPHARFSSEDHRLLTLADTIARGEWK